LFLLNIQLEGMGRAAVSYTSKFGTKFQLLTHFLRILRADFARGKDYSSL